MLRGSSWAVLARWAIRGVGLVSTVILARLLTPKDFGIYAMGAIVTGFLRLCTELGPDTFVLRSREAPPELCDSAWTIQVIQGAVVGVLLMLAAPLAVDFFHEPRLTPVFFVMAGTAAVGGLQNIGMTLVRKDLDFAKDFRFLLYSRLFKFVAIISLAFVMRSYWAPVYGTFATAIMTVALSFGMHRYRPRLGLHRAREILVFGASMLISNIGAFFNTKADVVLVGHIGTTAGMGQYNVAAELGSMATAEIVTPVGRGLLPAYAKVAHDRKLLIAAYLKSIGAIALLALPLGAGLSAIAPDAVRVILGEQWLRAIPLLRWLAIYALLKSLIDTIVGRVLIVIGKEWLVSALGWVRVGILVPLIAAAAVFQGVGAVPAAATLAATLALPIVMYKVCGALDMPMRQLLACLWRPVVAAVLMAAVILALRPLIDILLLRLFCEVLAGAATYVACLLLCWWVSGRPEGIEADCCKRVVARVRRAG
ncbi:MAG TPA: oligosaccharide flippase family protein [Rhodanobacteraceae bacterium]|nr:oligosaccharide flippase family protein [Rhodanobacteraceae bacterium]